MTRTIALKQIGTHRLVIRPLNEEDVPNIYGIMSDYETASKTGFKPLSSTSEAEGFFRESIRSGSAYGMTLKDKPSDIFGIILLTPEELETGAGACTETVEIGYFMRFFNFCAFCIYIRGGVGIFPGDCRLCHSSVFSCS